MDKLTKLISCAGTLMFLCLALYFGLTEGNIGAAAWMSFFSLFCETVYTRVQFREQIQALHGGLLVLTAKQSPSANKEEIIQ